MGGPLPGHEALWPFAAVPHWPRGGGGGRFVKKVKCSYFNFLILATDGSCGLSGWIVGVIVFVAVLVVCVCSFVVFCCARHVRRRKRGLLDDC